MVNFSPGVHYVNSVYADANLFCYARNRLSPHYKNAVTILGQLIAQQVSLFISHLVIDEVWWAFLRAWYRYRTGKALNAWQCKNNPSILMRFSALLYRNTEKILRLPNLEILATSNSKDIIKEARDIFSSENLMPRDCFHLGFVMANNIEGFITSDGDFDNLSIPNYSLTLYKY